MLEVSHLASPLWRDAQAAVEADPAIDHKQLAVGTVVQVSEVQPAKRGSLSSWALAVLHVHAYQSN
jgi:hypothetical protein